MQAALSVSAQAQDTKARSDNAIDAVNDTIVVTATKKANVENVQDVPVAITAFSAASLEAQKVRDIQGLTYSAPNVSLDQIGTSRGTANFSIRGLGVNSSIPSIDPTVGVFVDGVYIGVNAGLVFDMFDLASVELVRGPQGILFGRNTTGGAVLVNTGDPTDTLQAKVRLGFDGPVDSGRGAPNLTAQAVVSGPLIDGLLNYKVGYYYNYDQGYFTNKFDGSNFGQARTTIIRNAFELTPSDTIRMVAKLEVFDSEGDGPAGQNHGMFSRRTFDFSVDNRGFYKTNSVFATHKTEIELGEGLLTNIFGFRRYRAETDGDIDARPVFVFHSATRFHQKQFSDELRFNQKFGALDLTTGAYWFTQKLAYDEGRRFPAFISPLQQYGGGYQDHDVLGLFLTGDFALTDALTLTAGGRWSQEDKDARITYIRPRPACSVIDGTCPVSGTNPLLPTENNGFAQKRRWTSFTPKLGAQFRFNEDAQAYASWTRGFRSGGYNFRITNANAFEAIAALQGRSFDQETVNTYEAGVKFQTASHVLTLNLAAFRTDIGNMQREVNQASSTGVSQSIYNTADARIDGVEAETRLRLSDQILLTGNFGYLNGRYTRVKFDLSNDGVVDAKDLALDLPRTPKWTYGVGAIFNAEIVDGASLSARTAFQHRDRFAYTDSNYGWITASDNLEASVTWRSGDGLSVSIYGKNLLDEVQHGGDTQLGTAAQAAVFGGPLSTGVDAPYGENPKTGTFSPLVKGRILGIELGYDF